MVLGRRTTKGTDEAKPFGDVDQMILLNGAQSLSDVLDPPLSQGVTGLSMARNLLAGNSASSNSSNGASDASGGDPDVSGNATTGAPSKPGVPAEAESPPVQ